MFAYLTRTTPEYRDILMRQRSRLQALHQRVMERESHGQDGAVLVANSEIYDKRRRSTPESASHLLAI
jgi:hypothetical protein